MGVPVAHVYVLELPFGADAFASRLGTEGILSVSRVGFSACEMVIGVLIHGGLGKLGSCKSHGCLVFPVSGCLQPCCRNFDCCCPLCFLLLPCLSGFLLETWGW